ncbi:glycosyltransferase [Nibribacter ruber]|uniref:Glycosyltransferase n=1 Tax=Nibribacter ruber TaxID=2698458 RepID=A0A6P1NXX7_9BACT|nr:glycosyltransferase [Nibribacter ruber]QHL86788.1 glycosyltransferase [Nibribacter ruber]
MPEKILFTVTTDLRHDQRMQRIATTLAQAGCQVTLVGRKLPNSQPLPSAPYGQHRLSCVFHKGPLFYLEFNLRLFFWILRAPVDILGIVDADTALSGVLAAKVRRLKVTYDAHELFPQMPEVVNRPLVKKIWSWCERLAFKGADQTYTVSASLAEYFQNQYQRPVAVVRNMPFQVEMLPMPQQPPYFIYQGALNVGRGLECLLHALQGTEARLMICGTGPLEQELKNLAKQLQVEDRVQFMGNVPPEQLIMLTQQAIAGIMLLEQTGLSYYYSLANKFFDYVQAGIPQVCVNFPEYRALNQVHEVALLVDLEVQQVREALQRLLLDQPHYARMQHACLQARQNWNWSIESQRLLQIYAQL